MKPRVVCPYCSTRAKLVTGDQIYRNRPDLRKVKFWRCDPCNAHVGVHRKNRELNLTGTEPLGRLANAELRRLRMQLHAAFDPIWIRKTMDRGEAYAWLALEMGLAIEDTHIGHFDENQCRRALEICRAREPMRSEA